MISVVACSGVRACSHTPAATMPNAKPTSPVTKAAAKVLKRKTARSSEIEIMGLHSDATGMVRDRRLDTTASAVRFFSPVAAPAVECVIDRQRGVELRLVVPVHSREAE
jgi:hypothetical protein